MDSAFDVNNAQVCLYVDRDCQQPVIGQLKNMGENIEEKMKDKRQRQILNLFPVQQQQQKR